MDTQVVIAGAGPVGLFLAGELRLAGVSVLVVDPLAEPSPHSKGLIVHPRTVEVLASRGLLEPFLSEGITMPSGHFAALPSRLDYGPLGTDFPFVLSVPQTRTEKLLGDNASRLGVELRRRHRVTGFDEREREIAVTIEGPDGSYEVRADYLVGCDGANSTVRAAAGIDYVGTTSTVIDWLGDVSLDNPPDTVPYATFSGKGAVMLVRMPGGVFRFVGGTPRSVTTDWLGELTFEEFRANIISVTGSDFGMHSPTWLSRYGNASRIASSYAQGRVLLAGDAAHQHMPTGGVGLNLGVQDAMNLGWKLAAVLNGWAPDGLLAGYHDERHQVGEAVLEITQAQTALMSNYSPDGLRLRDVISSMIETMPEFSFTLAERISGLGVHYPPADPDAHPLTGRRVPNLGGTLFDSLNSGRYVLLEFNGSVGEVTHPWLITRSVARGELPPEWAGVDAALVRPDGYLAWAGAAGDARAAVAATSTATVARQTEPVTAVR
ncbi:FAD-dependent monooxygenase [Streptomyces prunicolor]|uniref:FAD-dependent monooxygenase n=1 Tax=Streptomyces prunicolor TaxID=67348 RepID=UPI00036D18AE|nr:FAD-dependent monooxygenase [Streptomyces prunicolor]